MIAWQIQIEGSETLCGGHVYLRSRQIFLDKVKAEKAIPEKIANAVADDRIFEHYQQNESMEPKGTLIEVEIVA